jgi:hypothetical protein
MASGQGFDRRYPKGRINEEDDGEMMYGIALNHETNRLMIRFSKPTLWIGLDTDSAMQLVTAIAQGLTKMTGQTVTVSIGDDEKSTGD